jgi:hypothetical protein
MTKVNQTEYTGFCLGGPWKGRPLSTYQDTYPLARMKPKMKPLPRDLDLIEWDETGRGQYEWAAGVWWWRGWNAQA